MCGPDVGGPSDSATASARQIRMLRTAMGPAIAAALEDPQVVEVLVNPDGSLWLDKLRSGREPTGVTLSPADAERIIRLVAAHLRTEVHAGAPVLSAELPETGERFEGVLPPVTRAPTFAIRKRAAGVIPLSRYVEECVMTQAHADTLRQAVLDRRNIVIAGGTSTGKTTRVNALLHVVAETRDRVILLEDTVELQRLSDDHVTMRTKPGVVTLAQLVRSVLRLRPDRIIVGEVRGAEALDLLKAWGTGHPGGIATLHAGSAHGALLRLVQLIMEVAVTVPRSLIADTVDLVVYIEGRGSARRVRDIVRVIGLEEECYRLESAWSIHRFDVALVVLSKISLWNRGFRLETRLYDFVDARTREMGCEMHDVEAARRFDYYIRILARDIERRASAHGLASSEWFVLEELKQHASICLRDLATAAAVSVSAASRAISRLGAAGLVDMRRISDNRRLSAISITDDGLQFLKNTYADEEGASRYHEVVATDDLNALARSLGALVSNVQ